MNNNNNPIGKPDTDTDSKVNPLIFAVGVVIGWLAKKAAGEGKFENILKDIGITNHTQNNKED